jgi:hypothetical protein
MRVGGKTKVMMVSAVCGFVFVPCSTVFGGARPVAATDQLTAEVIVGHVEERTGLDSATAVMTFGLLCAGAAFAAGRRVWGNEGDSEPLSPN